MAKWMNTAGADAALNYWAASDKLNLNTAQATTYTEGITTFSVGQVTPTYTGPAAGSPNGRKTQVDAKTGIAVTANGTVTHLSLTLAAGTTLRYVTTTTSQGVSFGGTADTGAWNINIGDPT